MSLSVVVALALKLCVNSTVKEKCYETVADCLRHKSKRDCEFGHFKNQYGVYWTLKDVINIQSDCWCCSPYKDKEKSCDQSTLYYWRKK